MSERNVHRAVRGPRAMLAEAMLFGSAALVACGGGDGKSAKTPEGGALGVDVVPTVGATVGPTEAPTIVPTATAAKPESLSPQELISAGDDVSKMFREGFDGLDVSTIPYDKIPQPAQRDLQSILDAVSICTGKVPYPYRDDAEKQRMAQDPTFLITGLSGLCALAGEASLRFYNALDNDPARQSQFEQANMQMEIIHLSMLKGFSQIHTNVPFKPSFWQSQKQQFYPFGATGTSN
ncbi:MAG: hypothetical protein AAB512_04375 [Patescibacteria group bacterium]